MTKAEDERAVLDAMRGKGPMTGTEISKEIWGKAATSSRRQAVYNALQRLLGGGQVCVTSHLIYPARWYLPGLSADVTAALIDVGAERLKD